MISVKKDFNDAPESLKTNSERRRNSEIQISSRYYRTDEVIGKLKEMYHNKCAYCESLKRNPEIEHYRPKSEYEHLAFEWSNLLPVCHECNASKSNKFPTQKEKCSDKSITNIQKINELEEPYLINPEVDNPQKYFSYNIKTGNIIPIKNNERATKTIEICDLDRTDLIVRRKKIFDELINFIRFGYLCSENNQLPEKGILQLIKRVKENTKTNSEFSAFHTQIDFAFPNEIIEQYIPEKQRYNIKKIYKNTQK